jgi:general secretion pathway protein C
MNKRLPLLFSLVSVILLAASLAYWILQLYQPPQRPLAAVAHNAMPPPPIDAAATLFGGQISKASASSYQLTGIVSAGRDSVAIIVAEGSPPKAIRMGKELVPGITLAEVHPRYVMLSDGGVMKRLDLAADAKAAAPMGASGAMNPPGVPMPAPPMTTGVEPPMAPGAVQQAPTQAQEFPNQGDAGQHDLQLPANQNSAPPNPNSAPVTPNNPPPSPAIQSNPNNPNASNARNPSLNNPAPPPVQMPPPTRPTGSPVGGAAPTTQ